MTASTSPFPARSSSGRAAPPSWPGSVASLGSRVLLCTGSDPARHRHLLGDVEPVAVVRVTREPLVDDARSALDEARAAGADSVVAIGGGSVLDLAKAVAVLLGNGTDPLDHLEVVGRGLPIERPAVPYVAVPTTAGTGAEATANAVLGAPEHGRKASIRSPHMLAAVALVDPLLTLPCPPAVTASSGLDALTQCLEPFVSPKANPATDAVAADGLRRGARSLRRAYEHGDDRAAREDMALCSLFGGIALANAKLGAVHGVAGVVGGMVDAPHGAVCAALLAPVVAANVRALRERDPGSPALDRYAAAARLLTGRDAATVEDAVAWLRETVEALQVPPLRGRGAAAGAVRGGGREVRPVEQHAGQPRGADRGRTRRGAGRRGRRLIRRHASGRAGGRAATRL